MKRIFLFLLIFTVLFSSAFASKKVRVGLYNNGALSFKTENGVEGFIVDMMDVVAKKNKWEIEYVHGTWGEMYSAVQEGSVDMMGPIAYSEKRLPLMNFTSETFLANWGRVYSSENVIINSIMDLNNKKIAVLKNDIYYTGTNGLKELLHGFGIKAHIIELSGSYDDLFKYVTEGKADTCLVSRLYGQENDKHYNLSGTVIFFNPIEIRMSVNKNAPEFIIKDFDSTLSILKSNKNSDYYQSIEKWFGEKKSSFYTKHLKTLVYYAALVTILSILIYLVMKSRLSKKVVELKELNNKLKMEMDSKAKTENELKVSEERLKYAVQGSEDVLWDWDLENDKIYLSDKFYENLGYEKDSLNCFEKLKSVIHKDDIKKFEANINEHKAGITSFYKSEFRLIKSDGNIIWVSDRGRIIERDDSGRPLRMCGMNRDISSSKKMEYMLIKNAEELEYKTNALKNLNENLKDIVYKESEKRFAHEEMLLQQSKLNSMSEMVGAVAHQWRQPLSSIALLIQDIKDAYDFDELDEGYINDIIEKSMSQIDMISETIDNFKGFFKSGEDESKFDIREIVADVLRLMESQYKIHNIVFSFRILNGEEETRFLQFSEIEFEPETVMYVSGYLNEFKQVLINILSNAKDAISEKRIKEYNSGYEGRIEFSIEYHNSSAVINILNNGLPIPEQIQNNIFDPYFTTKNSTVNKGIGLYMCKIIISEKMCGDISVANTPKGVVFSIKLPILPDNTEIVRKVDDYYEDI